MHRELNFVKQPRVKLNTKFISGGPYKLRLYENYGPGFEFRLRHRYIHALLYYFSLSRFGL
jgi:hypothetical protein